MELIAENEAVASDNDTFVDVSKIGSSIKKPKQGMYDEIPLFQELIQTSGAKELEDSLCFENFLSNEVIYNYGKCHFYVTQNIEFDAGEMGDKFYIVLDG